MKILPAIDLKAGRCVRLTRGQFDQVTDYADGPVEQAEDYQQSGAKMLHVIDLDGARTGQSANLSELFAIRQATTLTMQVGGGIRCRDSVKQLLDAGIDRVIIGSQAVESVEETRAWLRYFGHSRLVLAFDCQLDETKNPQVMTRGWSKQSDRSLWSLLGQYAGDETTLLCTDIAQDGMLTGPNVALYREGVRRFPAWSWQASGGIAALSDLARLAESGVSGAIIGKALLEERFTCEQALAEVAR